MANEKSSAVNFVNDVRIGKERTATFAGINLLPERNLTLYALAVLTFVKTAFAILEKSQDSLTDVIPQLASRQTVEEPLTICHRWRDHLHLDAFDDVFHVPIFERSLRQVTTKFGRPNTEYFQEVLREMLSIKSSVASITVRPPVCMACLKIFDSQGDVFVVFSPHPLPGQPGLSVTFCKSVEVIARRLRNFMPIMDRGGTLGENLNWQARLLSNCTSYIFVPRPSDDVDGALEESIMYSSLSLLTMQTAYADLQRQRQSLVKRNQDLEKKVEDLQRRLQEEKDGNVRRHIEPRPALRTVNQFTRQFDHGKDHPSLAQRTDSKDSGSDDLAIPPDDDPNLKLVSELKRTFDDENRQLTMQRDVLLKTAQRHYHCGICLDDFPEDDVVYIDTCKHKICRDCARGHVSAKINERRFPVLCPVCTADPRNRNPGAISGSLVQLLGVSEEQYQKWVEMEMAQFSVPINCQKCNQSMFVDRADAMASDRMQCPIPRCGHIWCQKCRQTIQNNNVEHSCDGSKEFENLVRMKKWKYCPSCRTPVEKRSGCDHLSCIVPGCNTHFCYRCGGIMNRTARPSEIMAGNTAYFCKCRF
ncbi:hypothetical protein EDD17DRAFT_1874323 [Pisolithus thermaeus]|nr:hypothetical protein EV401DRAFT_410876 [Pisolithus croceorrhizus]KAI6161841.1 hypothetical protein EDD17DRAFT_1874323 [Pisolithus thermaeus]